MRSSRPVAGVAALASELTRRRVSTEILAFQSLIDQESVEVQELLLDASASTRLLSLPAELAGRVLSFLGPRSLVQVAQTCCTLEHAAGANTLWSTLWRQRFGSIFDSPLFSAEGQLRSIPWSSYFSKGPGGGWKDFYFTFALTWLGTALAGGNSPTNCLIGLYGGIYDITDFLPNHPGSAGTLLSHAGVCLPYPRNTWHVTDTFMFACLHRIRCHRDV
jgi:hypothetical protein